MHRAFIIIGTRPEAIKLAPVVKALDDQDRLKPVIVATSQHRDMLRQALQPFGLRPDIDLDVMTDHQTPTRVAFEILRRLEPVLDRFTPTWTVVQGDTTTALAASIGSFYAGIPVAHVEAGLRTGRMDAPFPEEFNRRSIAVAASLHFAPTKRAAANLRREGIDAGTIHVVGNTVVDAVRHIVGSAPVLRDSARDVPTILVTLHRRESFGTPLRRAMEAIRRLALERPRNVRIVYPVHPNPNVSHPAREILGDVSNVELTEPMTYPDLLRTFATARLALSDSGGIQEEAPSVGTPVLVLRDTTERPEVLESGWARLVGTDPERILTQARQLLDDDSAYAAMTAGPNPFGDGRAAERIAALLAGALPPPSKPC